jgi:hypothetical protein
MEQKNATPVNYHQNLDPKTLIMKTLRKMKCKPRVHKNHKNEIYFEHLDKYYYIQFFKDCVLAYLFRPWWYEDKLDNPEKVNVIQKAVNQVNTIKTGTTTWYNVDPEVNVIGVHSRSELVLVPEIPDLDQYLLGKLYEMLQVQYKLEMVIEEETEVEQA